MSSYVLINISDFLFVEKVFARCFFFSCGFVIIHTGAFIQSGACFRFGARLNSLFGCPLSLEFVFFFTPLFSHLERGKAKSKPLSHSWRVPLSHSWRKLWVDAIDVIFFFLLPRAWICTMCGRSITVYSHIWTHAFQDGLAIGVQAWPCGLFVAPHSAVLYYIFCSVLQLAMGDWRCDLSHNGLDWTWEMVGHLYWIFALPTTFCCLQDLPNNLAMCLINWWLHSGRSVSNSTLQKQRLWQLKRNHRRHWRPALVWRWQGWFNGISTEIFWCYDYIGGCILRLRPEKARQFSVQAWPDLTWLHRWFVLQLGTAKIYTTDLRKLDVHCWKLLDVLWVRQLPLIGTSHGIQYLMHGTDGLINNWNTMVSKCGQRNVVNGQCLHAARRAYFGHRRQQWSVFGVVTVPCTRNLMHLTSFCQMWDKWYAKPMYIIQFFFSALKYFSLVYIEVVVSCNIQRFACIVFVPCGKRDSCAASYFHKRSICILAIFALDSTPKLSRSDRLLSQAYLVAAPHLSVWPFCRHSIVNPPYPPPSRIYPKFVTLQGQNLQIVECHPQSVGLPSCLEHRPDQNQHFQFLSSIASQPILELRWKVGGLKHSLVAHHLLWPRRVVHHMHSPTTTLSVLEPLVLVEFPTMLANVRGQINASDKSKLTIHIVIPAAAVLSSRRFAVNKCFSSLLPGRRPCCSSGCFASKISPNTAKDQIPKYLVEKPAACNGSEVSRLDGTQSFRQHSEGSEVPRVRNAPGLQNNIESCRCLGQKFLWNRLPQSLAPARQCLAQPQPPQPSMGSRWLAVERRAPAGWPYGAQPAPTPILKGCGGFEASVQRSKRCGEKKVFALWPPCLWKEEHRNPRHQLQP